MNLYKQLSKKLMLSFYLLDIFNKFFGEAGDKSNKVRWNLTMENGWICKHVHGHLQEYNWQGQWL